MSEDTNHPHSSYRVWQRIGNRDYHKVLPGLRVKRKGDWVVAVAIVAAGVMVGSMFALQSYGYIHPPLQVFGICPSPAYISGNGCYHNVVTLVNGAAQNKSVPCGPPQCYYVYVVNGSAVH